MNIIYTLYAYTFDQEVCKQHGTFSSFQCFSRILIY